MPWKRKTRWSGGMFGTIPTGRRGTWPAFATQLATWSVSCLTPSGATRRRWAAKTAHVSFSPWRPGMRRSTLWVCALVAIATLGCDKIKPIVDSIKAKLPGAKKAPATAIHPAADTTKAQAGTKGQPGTPTKAQPGAPAVQHPHPPRAASSEPVADRPYASQDTGTIDPGMADRPVYSQWGPPIGVRNRDEFTYIFYANGSERTYR